MGQVYRRPAARCDLITHYRYLAEKAGEVVADWFLSQSEASFDCRRILMPMLDNTDATGFSFPFYISIQENQ